MKIEEFKALKKGDLVKVMVNGYARYEKVETEPYYNPDCDEPTWEITTGNATYSYESVERAEGKPLSDDDRVFLRDLRKVMKSQNTCCQAAPRYWGIMETQIEYGVEEEYADDLVLEDGEDLIKDMEGVMSLLSRHADAICEEKGYAHMNMAYNPKTDSIDIVFLDEDCNEVDSIGIISLEGAADYIEDELGVEYPKLWYKEVSKLVEGPIFLTRKAWEEYLDKYGYNHAKSAYPYAMTAYRSPEVENLWRIVEETDWENI